MATWFTSDIHLGHRWASRLRYSGDDVDKHDAFLASRWDDRVQPDDVVFVLGDVAPGRTDDEVRAWVTARPGRKVLVTGNWDDGRNVADWGFDLTSEAGSIYLQGLGPLARLSHYPDAPTYGHEALLHGHTHKREKWSRREDGVLRIHVGWDAWRRLVPERDVVALIEEVRGE